MPSPHDLHEAADDEEGIEMALAGQMGMYDFSQVFDGSTKHADDAMDFSDEDELADEELPDEEPSRAQLARQGSVEEAGDASDGQPEDEPEDEPEDDLMAELEQEGMQGVDEDGDGDVVAGGLFNNSFLGNAGLKDLELEGDMAGDDDIDMGVAPAPAQPRKVRSKASQKEIDQKLLKVYYPSFQRGKPIKMQTLFPITPLQFPYQQTPDVKKPLIPTKMRFELAPDTRKPFRLTSVPKPSKRGPAWLPEPRVLSTEGVFAAKDSKEDHERPYPSAKPISSYRRDLILAAADWDDSLIIDGEPPKKKQKQQSHISSAVPKIVPDDWDSNLDRIVDGRLDLQTINLRLDMNDPRLLMEDEQKKRREKANKEKWAARDGAIVEHARIPSSIDELEARYNLSNDAAYSILKKNFHTKVRSTIGNLTIDHAPPALRLQSPYYPVKPTAKALRRYHRPQFQVRSNTTMLFSKPRTRKRKRDRGKDASQLFPRSEDLTVGDTAQFFFMEYSEECPVALSKFGMGSKIINYYRKLTEQDTSRPKLPIGETHVLGLEDRSPFWNFGYVENGNIVPTLYNQMIRAPLYQHDAAPTDFLLVRSSGNGSTQRYFLKSIGHMFTIGQTFPAVEVPGPHSRKVSSISKNRLKMIVFRLLNMNPHQRLLVKDISQHFPDHTDMQNRQRLKEFMEYQRAGEDQGFWKVKGHEKVPGYDATRRMISPEDICLLESMQAAQQRFDDIESFRRERLSSLDITEKEREREKQKEHAEESIALQLAPWNATKNFVQATQGKAMLQIHGLGDPSKRGDQFSFLKISMKGGFLKNVENKSEAGTPMSMTPATPRPENKKETKGPVHSYNVAEQQQLYDEEIAKVWYRQQRVLSAGGASRPRQVDNEKLKDDGEMRAANREVDHEVDELPRYLKITRMVRNSYGILERRVEVVRDPKVVELYVRRRQAMLLNDSAGLENDAAVLTNDAEENMKVKKRLEEELKKLEKQHEKKRKKVPGITSANIDSQGRISGKGIGKGKSTSRRCATCGALGHIRTNKSCPLYYTVHNKSNPNYIPGSEKNGHLLMEDQMS